ncbi:MAG: AraC family transcriptional regulator [Clostridia bacterium]|nr:AraC family transcriptional regulator [Clostridia bacterium]
MEKFIDEAVTSRQFVFDGDFGIVNIGYHNFSREYTPDKNSRVQSFYTWHFVLSGRGKLITGEKTYKIKGGQMFFLKPNTTIEYYPDEAEPWEYVWFAFRGGISEHYGDLLGFDTPVKDCKNREKIRYILKNCFETLKAGGGYFGVLSTFYKLMEISTVIQPDTGIEYVKRVIDEGYTRTDFSISSLCVEVGISHPHLLRLFKEKYNTTLIKYLNQKRIEYACQLLKTTDLSVKSVAFSSGFSDELHFMKTFKKNTGVPALRYKNKNIIKEVSGEKYETK